VTLRDGDSETDPTHTIGYDPIPFFKRPIRLSQADERGNFVRVFSGYGAKQDAEVYGSEQRKRWEAAEDFAASEVERSRALQE
jgi:hypothetical protein